MFTLSTLSLDRWGDRIWPLALNTLSEGTLVAGIQRNFLSTFESIGISSTWVFHQASGSASALTAGRDKYSFTSESSFSWSDGIAFACPEANYLFFFTLVICCNNPDILFSFLLVVVVEKMLCVVAAGGFSGCDASAITACLDCVSIVSLEPGIHKTVCYSSKAVCYICSEYF